MISTKEIITVEEFSSMANLTLAHTRQLLREGKLNGKKVGKEWKITREDENYELQISTFKNIVGTLGNIVGI